MTDVYNDPNVTLVQYKLPVVYVQFICHNSIDSAGFDVDQIFHDYYQYLIPNLNDTKLLHNVRINGMSDVPHNEWYYNSCNISSPQELITLEVEGWADLNVGTNGNGTAVAYDPDRLDQKVHFTQKLLKNMTSTNMELYFQKNVCSSMEIFQGFANANKKQYESGKNLDHNLYLLCGGADYVYYGEGDTDGGFLVLGLLVGVVMVAMIFVELSQFQPRPTTGGSGRGSRSPPNGGRSDRRRRRGEYVSTSTFTELEMV